MTVDNFIEIVEKEAIDYNQLLSENVAIVYDQEEFFDVNFIITVRGRLNFAQPMYSSFSEAHKKSGLKICYTIVEHSYNPEHSKFCKKNKINYFWIKATSDSMFNKCLSYNVGAMFGPKSKYLLFHDIDCLVQSNFFSSLMENVKNKNCKAIQCFTKRRVLYCNELLTQKIINKEFSVDDLSIENENVKLPMYIGAPGGSIMIERDLFFDVGGYDGEFFRGNSPEDAFFWDKVDCVEKMETSNDPDIEIFHMNHPVTYYDNPHISDMNRLYELFKTFSNDDKLKYIEKKKQTILNYK